MGDMRADGKFHRFITFDQMLKSFDREDLETLWKLVKAKYGSTRPIDIMDRVLWGDLKVMLEPHLEGRVWQDQFQNDVLF